MHDTAFIKSFSISAFSSSDSPHRTPASLLSFSSSQDDDRLLTSLCLRQSTFWICFKTVIRHVDVWWQQYICCLHTESLVLLHERKLLVAFGCLWPRQLLVTTQKIRRVFASSTRSWTPLYGKEERNVQYYITNLAQSYALSRYVAHNFLAHKTSAQKWRFVL